MFPMQPILQQAFNEAISTVPYNGMDPQTAAETIKVAMKNIAERDYHDFTDDEIKATIIAGFDSLKEVGQDFKIQTWTMKQVGGQNIILLAYKLN